MMYTLATAWRRIRLMAILGLGAGALVGAASYALLPRKKAVDLAFVVDAQQTGQGGAAALAGLLGERGDQSSSPDFYAYLTSTDEVQYRIACLLSGAPPTACDRGDLDRVALAKVVGRLKDQISATVSRSTGVVTVRVVADDDSAAVAMGEAVLATLESYNRAIRRTRASEEVRVSTRLRDSLRTELSKAEEEVRAFQEANREMGSPRVRLQLQRLERRVELVTQAYLTLARDTQEAELRQSRDTPVITILQRPRLPARQVSPPTLPKLLLGSTLLGLVLGIAYALSLPRVTRLREYVREKAPAAALS